MKTAKIEVLGKNIIDFRDSTNGKQVVYAIFFKDRVKIGKSSNVIARVRQIESQQSCRAQEVWYCVFNNYFSDAEKYMHSSLADSRIAGEYFKVTREDVKNCFNACFLVDFSIKQKNRNSYDVKKSEDLVFNILCKMYGLTRLEAIEDLMSRLKEFDKSRIAAKIRYLIVKNELEQIVMDKGGNIETITEMFYAIKHAFDPHIKDECYFIHSSFVIHLIAESIKRKHTHGHDLIIKTVNNVVDSVKSIISKHTNPQLA